MERGTFPVKSVTFVVRMKTDPKQIRIEEYAYPLPDERIAKYPLAKRDEAKLLSYADGKIKSYKFREIVDLLPADALLVMNKTKVIRARLEFFRSTGARIEIFCLEPHEPALYEQALATLHEVTWHCMIGQARKWKEEFLERDLGDGYSLRVSRVGAVEGQVGALVRFQWDSSQTFGEILEQMGELPIPPYLNRKSEESDLTDYQTVYATEEGSVAAPTAGLHFTDELLEAIEAKGIMQEKITLHVGAGTFLPVKSETMAEHEMHSEVIEVSIDTIRELQAQLLMGQPIVAIGTTSARTLESLYYIGTQILELAPEPFRVPQWIPYSKPHHFSVIEALQAIIDHLEFSGTDRLIGQTRLIIIPGYEYKVIDYLVTNFHQPRSTLLLLVAAFVGADWRDIYDYALANDYRFLSYGDASILKKR